MIQCAADTYQYISRIIENALKQTEQLLLKLKTRRDDTTITVKNKTGSLGIFMISSLVEIPISSECKYVLYLFFFFFLT